MLKICPLFANLKIEGKNGGKTAQQKGEATSTGATGEHTSDCYRYKWHLKLLQVQVTPQIATGDNSNCNGCRHLKLLLCAQCYVQLNQSCWIKSFDLFSDTLTPNSEGAAKKLLPVGIILSVRLEIWQELFTVRYATNCTYYKCNFFYCIKTIANMDQSNIFQWAGQQIKI